MAGKQAKLLSDGEVRRALGIIKRNHRHPLRDLVVLMLSVKAGLRACEIARLDWSMVTDARGRIATEIALQDRAAKKGSGRRIPMHPDLRRQLSRLLAESDHLGPVIRSERGTRMRSTSIVNWFRALYRVVGLTGCSSHSGRRTFITKAARCASKVGGSLRDVQQLAGHRSLSMTQRYIDTDENTKRRLIRLL